MRINLNLCFSTWLSFSLTLCRLCPVARSTYNNTFWTLYALAEMGHNGQFPLNKQGKFLSGWLHSMCNTHTQRLLSIDWFDHPCSNLSLFPVYTTRMCSVHSAFESSPNISCDIFSYIALNNNECALCTKYQVFYSNYRFGKRQKGYRIESVYRDSIKTEHGPHSISQIRKISMAS